MVEDLPKLPFEQVLSYLSLADRLKARSVSRAWRNKFYLYPVQSLCYSSRPSDFILGKNRWVSGAFVENFISSTRFASFFNTFDQTILSSLKHLRLCKVDLSVGDRAAFARILNSLCQLEKLDIIRARLNQKDAIKVNLPMLTSLQIEDVNGIQKLILEASRLREVKLLDYYGTGLRVEIVHGESVERLLIDWLGYINVKKLKNLLYLYVNYLREIDPTFLSNLQQLKEIHTNGPDDVSKLFEQKQRLDRADLKIYLCGLLLSGPADPAMNALRYSAFGYLSGRSLVCLAENLSRLGDEIRFYRKLRYSEIEEFVVPGLEVDLLKLFPDLNGVKALRPVQDIQRFLGLLKNYENIVELRLDGDQPQDLFDRLPEHCAVQKLTLYYRPSDLDFLFRLKHLIDLYVDWPIESETVRRAFEELPALFSFKFVYDQKRASIEIGHHKQFQISVGEKKRTTATALNAVIEFIFEN